MAPRLLTAGVYPCPMLVLGDSKHQHMALRTRILRILGGVEGEITGETVPLVVDRHHLARAGTRASIIIKSSTFSPYVALY